MNKKELISILSIAKNNKKICKLSFEFTEQYFFYYPLIIGKYYFLAIEDFDFFIDGYVIRPYNVIENIEFRDGLYSYINEKEGITDSIITPEINLESWKTIFENLYTLNKIISVENEFSEEFAIGYIEEIFDDKVFFRHFDTNGNWMDGYIEIPYSTITSITFNSRYTNVWEKYVSPLPKNFRSNKVVELGEKNEI